ncbi:MAG: hypothetical protein KBD01_15250 [Acidobacteria bacterium]|nr:hypothetical protein [Acidobacteriota bacterium]
MRTDAIGRLLLAVVLLGGGVALAAGRAEVTDPSKVPAPARARRPAELTPSAQRYYRTQYGVEIVGAKLASSGALVRFSYKVTDEGKARIVNDRRSTAILVDERTGAHLAVPVMEKVGPLRQTFSPENGKEYWILFSNKGGLVKPGSRVDVLIGNFRAIGLAVAGD